jgi:hypothetical protein
MQELHTEFSLGNLVENGHLEDREGGGKVT